MLERLEKIQWGLCGLAVLAVAVMFFYPGLSTVLSDVPTPTERTEASDFTKSLAPAAAAKHDVESNQASISAKLGPNATQPPKQEYFFVPEDSVTHLSDKRHVITELDMAASKLDPKSRALTITTIKDESMLRSLGFQSGDVIKGLNGKPIPFGDPDALWSLYDDQMGRLARGEAIIISLDRNGQPVQFHFAPDKVRKLLR